MAYRKISGFSDEISKDIKEQFEALNRLGIKYFEPRGINGKNISELDDDEVFNLKAQMYRYNINVSSIGSPIGKKKLSDDFEAHFEKFKRVVRTAKLLDTKYIRMFSFYNDRDEWTVDDRAVVIDRLSRMIAYAKENDVVLLHENEKGIYGDTAERCLDLMKELYCDNFKAVFDPANFVQCKQDTKQAYDMLKDYIEYMHIKDAKMEDGTVVPSGYGDGNVPYILGELFNNGYAGFVSLEPHLGSFEGLAALELDDKMENLPKGGEGTFTVAYNALCKILKNINVQEDKNMKKVKMGIIGYGNMGSIHVRHLMRGDIEKMELAAVCDISEARRSALKEAYPDVPVFDNAEDMFKSGLCDSVLIAVPHYDHPPLAIKAFEYGLNVLTEKPAGVYTKQVKEMNEAAKRSGKVFGIMYNQRTNPVYQKLREMVQSGELGHIKRVTWIITNWYRPQAYHDSSDWRSTWSKEGGGTLINQNPHQIDLWQWIFGVPDKIFAKMSFGKYYNIEVEDDVMAYFEYANGTTGEYITSTGEAPGTNRLEVACDMGKVVIENRKIIFTKNVMSEREYNKINTSSFAKIENEVIELDVDNSGGEQHNGILKNYADAVLEGTELLAKGEEGINGLTISNSMHLSAWTGETVDVKNFPDDKYYELLQDKIKNSTFVKVSKNTVSDITGTY